MFIKDAIIRNWEGAASLDVSSEKPRRLGQSEICQR